MKYTRTRWSLKIILPTRHCFSNFNNIPTLQHKGIHIFCSKEVRTSFKNSDKTGRSGFSLVRPFIMSSLGLSWLLCKALYFSNISKRYAIKFPLLNKYLGGILMNISRFFNQKLFYFHFGRGRCKKFYRFGEIYVLVKCQLFAEKLL